MRKVLNFWFRDGPHGNFLVINGKPRTGKTNLGCLMIEALIDMDIDVITTIQITKDIPRIHHISWFSEFLRAFINIKGDNVFIVDDGQSSMGTSLNVTSKKARHNTALLNYIGKFQSNLIYISHIPEYIPRNIYEFDPIFIEKPDKKSMIWMGERYFNIPKTNLPFQTFSPSHWDYDVDIDKLYAEISRVPENKIKETIRNFLDGSDSKRKIDKKEIFFWLMDHGYPEKSHYDIFPSFYNWKKEYQKNRS